MIHIRKAEKQDLEELANVHLQCWREAYPSIIPDEILNGLSHKGYIESWSPAFENGSETSVFVALDGERIVGLAASGKQRDENLKGMYPGEFYAIYVLKDSQRNKAGVLLLSAMGRDLKSRNLVAATLWVLEDNTNARRFYERTGGVAGSTKNISFQGIEKTEIFYVWKDIDQLDANLEKIIAA